MIQAAQQVPVRVKARVAGLFELLEALFSGFGMVVVPRMLIVASSAAATVTNVRTHEGLFRMSILAGLLGIAFHTVWVYLFYELFKPVSRSVSLLAAFFGLVAIAVQGVSSVLQMTPLIWLQAGADASGLSGDQTIGLTFFFLQLSGRAFNTYLVFFGFWCVLVGYLIVRSTFMPRIIGWLEVLAGLSWLTFIWPPFAHYVSPYNQMLALPGELSLMFWLLAIGVNTQRWNEQANSQHALPLTFGDI